MMEQGNKRKIVIVILIVAILYIVVALILGGKNPTDTVKPKYLMIDNKLIWQKTNNQWFQLKTEPTDFYDNDLTVYYGTEKMNNVKVQNNDGVLYYFDKDYNQLKLDDVRALTTNLNLKFASYDTTQATDADQAYIDYALKKIDAENVGRYKTKKISYDFDGDGVLETLYITDNFVFDVVDYQFYSVFYMVKNNQVSQVIATDEKPYGLIEVVDIDNDNVYELIMAYDLKNLPSYSTCYQLYDYIDGKWKMTKNC